MAAFTQALVTVLHESLREPGVHILARLLPANFIKNTPRPLATFIKNTPELTLNMSLLVEAFLQVLASGLGTLALVWATVVLLGGFSTMLGRMDFWFITAIVFVETARIVGYNSAPEAKFFVGVHAALCQKDISGGTRQSVLTMLLTGIALALAPVFLATACTSLSVARLVGIARHGYGGSTSIDASNGNMKPALILFYALVLTQGTLFLLCLAVAVIRSKDAINLSQIYHLRTELIDRYVSSIADRCIQNGVTATINTNLVSFSEELLLQSQHQDDRTSAVLVLHTLVIESQNRSDGAVEQICSSEKLVYRLVRMLGSEDLDADTKGKIAEIVAKLACRLSLADIPGAAHCISSLLDSRFIMMKNAVQTGPNPQPIGVNQTTVDIDSRGEIKPLFVHGLVILRELASNPENCTEMYNIMDLVPKIIAPVSNELHMVIKNDETTVEIVRESLLVLDKLTRGTGESSRKLCHELATTKYGRTAENILWILSNSSDQEMRFLAVVILSRLTLDEPRIMLQFTVELRRLLLDPQDSQLRIEAGKALIARGDEFPDIQQLVTIIASDEYSKEYRAVIAEMLAQICAKSTADQDRISRLSSVANALSTVIEAIVTETTDMLAQICARSSRLDQDRINRLSAVANSLSTVLKAIVTETTNITELDKSKRRFLASFLGLAVQIREKLATAEAFADAVAGLAMANNLIFAETLKRIIEVTKDSEAGELCLEIIKSATKLVTWMTEIDSAAISSGYYTDYFRQVNIVQELDAAVRAMVGLERYVVMTGGADEKEGYVTLQTLVETAKNKLLVPLPRQQQQLS